jgi:hypothetical protein
MLLARSLYNRFLLHARHVLRAVASGQEGGATSGRAAIGGRGCARQRVVDACPAEWGRPARAGVRDPGARREGCDDARPPDTPVLELAIA